MHLHWPLLLVVLALAVQEGHADCTIGTTSYNKGKQFSVACFPFSCGDTGKFLLGEGYLSSCENCSIRNDPHFTTFDGVRYDWHGDNAYVVAQEENTNGRVVSYVYSKFTKCWGKPKDPSCVDTVYFKPMDSVPLITVRKPPTKDPKSDAEVMLDGGAWQRITVTGSYMQVLKGNGGQEYHALAFWYNNCLHIISVDQLGFMVEVCSNYLKVFSHKNPKIHGLCGSPDGDANNDLLPKGSTVPVTNPHKGVVSAVFADSWKAPPPIGQRSVRAQEVEMEPCKASEVDKAEYIRQCQEVLDKYASLSEAMKKAFIDSCAFDICMIIQAKTDEVTVDDWLNAWTKMSDQEVFEQEHQIDMPEFHYEILKEVYYNELAEQENNLISTSAAAPSTAAPSTAAPSTAAATTVAPTTTKALSTAPATTAAATTATVCRRKCPCRFYGGKCQPNAEECKGMRLTGKKFCSNYGSCTCCIPKLDPTGTVETMFSRLELELKKMEKKLDEINQKLN